MASTYYYSQPQGSVANASEHVPASPERPALPRSISLTNLETTRLCREAIQQDWCTNAPAGGTNFFTRTPYSTLTLPSLNEYPPEFKQFVFDRIVDKETQRALEAEKCLNWCASATKLVPLYTLGDGNCLLHAASLGMWGFHDRDLILRRAISHAVHYANGNTFMRRWQYTRQQDNEQYQVELDEQQWLAEWETIVKLAAVEVPPGKTLESLEEFHIFVLANVLRRPVIMYAIPKMRSYHGATLQRVNFHGVYLPLLWDPSSCKKDPLPLAFYGGHFSALVAIEFPQQYRDGHLVLPLTDYYGQHLPIRFALGQEDPTALMMDYLDLNQVPDHASPYATSGHVICAKLKIHDVPAYLRDLLSGFIDTCYDCYGQEHPPMRQPQPRPQTVPHTLGAQYPSSTSTSTTRAATFSGGQRVIPNGHASPASQMESAPIHKSGSQTQLSCINNCGNYASTEFGFCSACLKKHMTAQQEIEHERTAVVPGASPTVSRHSEPAAQPCQQREQPPSASQGYMKCAHCSNPGHPDRLGMCESCYRQSQGGARSPPISQVQPTQQVAMSQSHGAQAPAVDSRPPIPQPQLGVYTGQRSQCKMPGCEFFGTAETRFYCSKCFDANMKDILSKEVGSATTPVDTPFGTESPLTQALTSDLCRQCRKVHGSRDYNGLCTGCFRKSTQGTQVDRPPVQQPLSVPPSSFGDHYMTACATPGCNNPAGPNGYCASCDQSSSQRYRAHSARVSANPAYDKPSREVVTTPVQRVVDSVDRMSLSHGDAVPSCFICEGRLRDNVQMHAVCQKHAEQVMQSMFGRPPSSGQPTSSQSRGSPLIPEKSAPDPTYGRRDQLHSPPYTYATVNKPSNPHGLYSQAGSGSRAFTSSTGRPMDPPMPSYTGQPGYPSKMAPQYGYPDPQLGDHASGYPQGMGQDPRGAGQYRDPHRSDRSLSVNQDPRGAGQYRDPYGAEQYRSRQGPMTSPVPTSPHRPRGREEDRGALYADQGAQGAMQDRYDPSFVQPKPPPQQQPAPMPKQTPGLLGQPRAGEVLQASRGRMQDREEASGGEKSGASGVGGAAGTSAVHKDMPVKVLCKTPGCSFKGVRELNWLCPECHDETYGK